MKKKYAFTSIILSVSIFAFYSFTSNSSTSHSAAINLQETSIRKGMNSIDEAREILQEMIEQENIVGLAISVSHQDSIIWSAGFGYSDLDKKTPIKPESTYFRIASLSKPITATIMGRLCEERILDLDKSVYEYVPNFPKKKYDFTIRHLASHRSGVRHYKKFEKENKKPLSIEEGLNKFKKSQLKFEPGTEYLYSSYGYNLLGVAMEKATQEPFEDLLKKYVTKPLNMNHTIADNSVYDNLETSGFFDFNWRNKLRKAKPVNMLMKVPSGGMLSTSEDLVRFGNAFSYQRILQKETQNEILSNVPLPNGKKTGYGLGWGIKTDKKGRKIISHSGGNSGSVCRLIIYPEEKLTLAIVSNTFGIDWLKFMKNVNSISNKIVEEIEEN